jgi:hypothetical protein
VKVLVFTVFLTLLLGTVGFAQDSMNVRCVGRVNTTPNQALDVEVVGGYAYVVGDSLLRIISISDLQPPVQVGCVEAAGSQLAVQGGYAYVAAGRDGLRVVSVTDAANPVEVGLFDTPCYATGVVVSGDYAYVADLDSGLRVISIADPTNPVEVAHIDTFGITYSVAVSGDHVYVGAQGLKTVLISDPTHPVTVGGCNLFAFVTCVAVSGNYAYVVDWDNLDVIRVADPTHPVLVWQQSGDYGGVAVAGGRLHLGAKGVRVYSIADPGSPVKIGHYTFAGTGGAAGVAADDEYAYVACSWQGLQIYQYYGAGVAEETMSDEREAMSPGPSIVRGVLFMTGARDEGQGTRDELLDISGRKVLNLRPGANDVSHLAPGIYFMREVQAQAQAVRKIVIQR